MFPDLFSAIGTTYGAGDGSTTFNLPNYSDGKFPEGSTVAGAVKQAGLPNIEGELSPVQIDANSTVVYPIGSGALIGADVRSSGYTGRAEQSGKEIKELGFDASRSNPIYGASNTVQPYSLTTRFIIKAYDGVTPTPSQADISQILTELTGKADRDLDNLSATGEARFAHVVVDSYYDSTTGDWWREYADGWVEQGGIVPYTSDGTKTINLLKPYESAIYNLIISRYSTVTGWDPSANLVGEYLASTANVHYSNTSFQFTDHTKLGMSWRAAGMGAQS
jgi:hypothetical protein